MMQDLVEELIDREISKLPTRAAVQAVLLAHTRKNRLFKKAPKFIYDENLGLLDKVIRVRRIMKKRVRAKVRKDIEAFAKARAEDAAARATRKPDPADYYIDLSPVLGLNAEDFSRLGIKRLDVFRRDSPEAAAAMEKTRAAILRDRDRNRKRIIAKDHGIADVFEGLSIEEIAGDMSTEDIDWISRLAAVIKDIRLN